MMSLNGISFDQEVTLEVFKTYNAKKSKALMLIVSAVKGGTVAEFSVVLLDEGMVKIECFYDGLKALAVYMPLLVKLEKRVFRQIDDLLVFCQNNLHCIPVKKAY